MSTINIDVFLVVPAYKSTKKTGGSRPDDWPMFVDRTDAEKFIKAMMPDHKVIPAVISFDHDDLESPYHSHKVPQLQDRPHGRPSILTLSESRIGARV